METSELLMCAYVIVLVIAAFWLTGRDMRER
jgi:hypothetical protein